ncbi:MAG TPA: lytic murein transglycosylase [Streptomyces sp.]|nr:lytic murein transglycosylase [Streptomyces sp.]
MAARLGGRVRKGVTSTAVAAAAMAALTASQAPGMEFAQSGGRDTTASPPLSDLPADGNSPYHTELPPLDTPGKPGGHREPPEDGTGLGTGPAEAGIPATVLAAYKKAERTLGAEQPGCNLSWQLLAAIGKVESGQARGGAVDAEGTTFKPILGPALNGIGFARITDTDGGLYDGDTQFDRAVGPMQFIPSTWASWGADGNGDGRKDPNNIYDAALAAGRYLCAGGRDLSSQGDLEQAILSYNRSREYLRTVLSWLEFYRKGVHEVPDGKGVLPESPGAGNESRPSTDPTSRPRTEPGGKGGPKDATGPKDTEGPKGPGGSKEPGAPGSGGKTTVPRPTASASGSIAPKPTKTPKPSPTGPAAPDPSGSDEPEPTPTECPADPVSPSPSESETPSEPPTTTPSPTPTGDPDEPGGDDGDPENEDGEEEPKDPCGDPGSEDGEDGVTSTEGGSGSQDGPAPAPSLSMAVSGRLD